MSEPKHRIDELLARIEFTAHARHNASERFAAHQKLSLCMLVVFAFALVFIALINMTEMNAGIDLTYVPVMEVVLSVMVLVYALLVGQEKFALAAQSMRRSAIELERLARRVAVRDPQKMTDMEYSASVKEYFDILEKSENHQAIDCLASRLKEKPRAPGDWPAYSWLWMRAQLFGACKYLHYVVSMGFVVFVFLCLFDPVAGSDDTEASVSPDAPVAENTARENSGRINAPPTERKRR